MTKYAGLLAAGVLLLSACGPQGGGGGPSGCELGGTINAELTLSPSTCDPYLVVGDLSIGESGKLTLAPGTTLVFSQDTGLYVAGHGALVAQGTATEPVVMKGASAIFGYWKGLRFEDADSFDNKLVYAEIRDAAGEDLWDNGAFGTYRAAVVLDGRSRVLVKHSKVWKNDGAAFFVDDEVDLYHDFAANTLTANFGFPLLVYASRVEQIKANNDFANNAAGYDYVRVAGGFGQVEEGTWRKLNVPYRLFGEVAIANGKTLTVEAGTTLVFEQDARLTAMDYQGGLKAQGTASDPIVFRGLESRQGYWCGLYFHDTDNPNNLLEHVVVKDGGSDAAACASQSDYFADVLVDSSGNASRQQITIRDSRIENSGHYGLVVADTTQLTLFNVQYANNRDGDFREESY